jgi:hypothetical protein
MAGQHAAKPAGIAQGPAAPRRLRQRGRCVHLPDHNGHPRHWSSHKQL